VLTIGLQMTEGMRRHLKLDKAEAAQRAVALLTRTGIRDAAQVMKKYPHQLSGGMRQRVMIAMALACKPKILIADEPTTALDVTIQAQILHLMNELKRTTGTAIIFITHDLGVINEMADDVAVMYCGQVVERAPAEVIFRNCEESHPYTEGLMESIPRLDTEAERLDPIPGVVPHPLALPKGCKFAPRCKYCTQKCLEEEPELVQIHENQLIRCFYPNKEERNSAEHQEITVNH
jgi:peptide/nickel transport system ATP-binding protein